MEPRRGTQGFPVVRAAPVRFAGSLVRALGPGRVPLVPSPATMPGSAEDLAPLTPPARIEPLAPTARPGGAALTRLRAFGSLAPGDRPPRLSPEEWVDL